jgi:hypothetical protein
VHRIVQKITCGIERLLDIGQAFDKVCKVGLLYKLKLHLPHIIYSILKSYVADTQFHVKLQNASTTLYQILSGVPQGSVLGPILCLTYTTDIPTTRVTGMADDTAILASHADPVFTSCNLQIHLRNLHTCFRKWKLEVNEAKSLHVTFALKRDVTFNGVTIRQADDTEYLGKHLDRRLTLQNANNWG